MPEVVKEKINNFTVKIKSGTIWISIRFIISSLLAMVTMPLIARWLPVEEYGIYNLLFSLMGYIAVFSAFGVTNIFQRFIPAANQKKKIGLIKNLVFKGLVLRLILSSIAVFLIILFSDQVGKLLKVEEWYGYFSYFGIGIVFFLEISLLSVALQGVFLHKYSSLANIICVVLRTTGICWVLLTSKGLRGVLWIEVITWVLNFTILLFFYNRKFLEQHKNVVLSPLPVKRFAIYGGYSFFSEIGFALFSSSTDLLIISMFLGPVSAGMYGLCDRVIKLFQRILPNSVLKEMIVPVFFSRYAQNNNLRELNRMFNFLVKINLFFALPFALYIFVLGDKIIPLIFGNKFNDSYLTMCVVVGFFVMNAIQDPTENTLRAIEKVNIVFWAQMFAVLNLIGDLLVVKSFGIIGVACVTSIAVFLKNLFCFYHARKNAHLALESKAIITIIMNSLVLFLFIYFAQNFITGVLSLILVFFFGALLYLSVNYFNSFFNSEEKQFLSAVVPIKIWH